MAVKTFRGRIRKYGIGILYLMDKEMREPWPSIIRIRSQEEQPLGIPTHKLQDLGKKKSSQRIPSRTGLRNVEFPQMWNYTTQDLFLEP